MISHQHRLIFIHIPKCAGTSVERRFGHFNGFSGRDGQDHRPIRMIEPRAPLDAALRGKDELRIVAKRLLHPLRRHANPHNRATVTAEQFKSYYKFTIVRDPWSRVLSWYRNVIRDPIHLKRHGVSQDMPFEDFVENFGGRGMLAPIPWWICSFDGSIPLDRIVDFDNLQEEFALVLRDLGLPPDPLSQHNVGGERIDVERAYTPRALAAIDRFYGDEITRFGFRLKQSA